MSEELVKIEVDGVALEARKGAMLIEVTDAAGIPIPRFCYHKKLSVAANCRMCLVEVEKAPKPLPACATPVMDGMRVSTRSPKAIAAQRGTMEFLLINHPLDCPICDQGGECELQDVAMAYGSDVSRFQEGKRVVRDKDIGPLIATEMTRCIHCTRCVRFGEEIAGLREMGATGRGDSTEIGTYVAHTVASELSANIVDLCPVGALTAKPSRFAGRSWEFVQHAGVAPHDSVGSNIYLHTLRGELKRVVPRECEEINEAWLSDRDRFGYEGVAAEDRALQPLLRSNGALAPTRWETALEAAVAGLRQVIATHGTDAVGVLAAPTATVEELYLLQKFARGLGLTNIDHRLRQADFGDQDQAPLFPWLGQTLAELGAADAVLLVGSNVRMEQPLAGHRIRKAALAGARVSVVNPRDFDFRFPLAERCIAGPQGMLDALAGVARAVAEARGVTPPAALALDGVKAGTAEQAIASQLIEAERGTVLLGNLAAAHPGLSRLRALAGFIAEHAEVRLGYLAEAGNSAGAWLAGALPHRGAGGAPTSAGLDARAMLAEPRKAYVLLGVEPGLDCWDGAAARAALEAAEFVVVLSPYVAETEPYAHVHLPLAAFSETSGTYVNAEGRWQGFAGAVRPCGEARPGWKVLRVLGNVAGLDGFDYADSSEVAEELRAQCGAQPDNRVEAQAGSNDLGLNGALQRVGDVPIYATDALVRRARSLQRTPLAQQAAVARISPAEAASRGLEGVERVVVRQGVAEVVLPLVVDAGIPAGCLWVPAGLAQTAALGAAFGAVEVVAA